MCQLPLKNHPYRMVARMTREMPQMRILNGPILLASLEPRRPNAATTS